MRTLPLYSVDATDHLVQPHHFSYADISSPALELLEDFSHRTPDVIDADTPAIDAQEMMLREHSRFKLVINAHGELVGLIEQAQLSGQAMMRRVANGDMRHEIVVSDMMHTRQQLKALSYAQLQDSTIGDVITTLRHSGESYCLIVDRSQHQIRGVISARELAERLHIDLDINKAPTFLNIFDSLAD